MNRLSSLPTNRVSLVVNTNDGSAHGGAVAPPTPEISDNIHGKQITSRIAQIDPRSEQPRRRTAYPRHHGRSRSILVKHAVGRSRYRPGERHCATAIWRPELPGSYRFGRAARLPQLTPYANDALSQLIQRKEQLAP